jgi:hypothetical protein
MWGAAEEGRDKLTVTAVPDATHITVAALPRNYSSGSWIGVFPVTAIMSASAVTGFPSTHYGYMPLDAVGTAGYTSGTPAYAGRFSLTNQLQAGTGPDYRLNKDLLRPVFLYHLDKIATAQGPSLAGYLSTAVILQQYRAVTALDLFLVYDGYVYPVTGTATAGGATTLTDTGKSLTVNAWANYILVLLSGVGIGQTRKIISNTATEFTVATWEINPDNTTVYAVVTEAWRTLGDGGINNAVAKEII